MEITDLKSILDERFSGVLSAGKHDENGHCCALELLSVAIGTNWTDNPSVTRCVDLRALNDINVSDEIRTQYMLPVIAAWAGSLDWPTEILKERMSKVAILTVSRLVSELPGLPDQIRKQCQDASTLKTAESSAAWAESAARAAASAAARAEEKEKVFIVACQIWIDALA